MPPTFRSLLRFALLYGILLVPQQFAYAEPEPRHIAAGRHQITVVDADRFTPSTPVTLTRIAGLDQLHSPMSITIISREQILAMGARSLSDVLELHVPGFQVMTNKWAGTLWGLRGVSSDINDKFIFLVNGIQQGLQSRDGVAAETDQGLLVDIDRIEVLLGPAGITYGSGAIAGVINVVTRRHPPLLDEQATAAAWSPKHGTGSADIGLTLPLTPSLTAIATFGYKKSTGIGSDHGRIFGTPSTPDITDMEDVPDAPFPVSGSPGKIPGDLRTSLDLSVADFRWYTRFTKQERTAAGLFVYDPWYWFVSPADSIHAGSVVNGDSIRPTRIVNGDTIVHEDQYFEYWSQTEGYGFNRRVYRFDNLTSGIAWGRAIGLDSVHAGIEGCATTDRVDLEDLPGWPDDPPDAVTEQIFGERRGGLNATYFFRRLRTLGGAAGFEYRLDDIGPSIGNENRLRNRTIPVVRPVRYNNLALFAEGLLAPDSAAKWNISAGIRADIHSRLDKPLLSPRAAIVWLPKRTHAVKLIFQSSSNAGTADIYEPNFYFLTDGNTVVNRPHFEDARIHPDEGTEVIPSWHWIDSAIIANIRPEHSRSIELATTHDLFARDLHIGTSVSINMLQDLLLWSQPLYRRVNTGDYSSLSCSIEGAYRPYRRKFKVSGSHTWQRVLTADDDNTTYTIPGIAFDRTGIWYDSTRASNGSWLYTPKTNGSDAAVTVSGIRDQISNDGVHFLNLSPHTTKLILDIFPADRLSLHLDGRIFWGLPGRSALTPPGRKGSYLDIDKTPIVKADAGISWSPVHNGTGMRGGRSPFAHVNLSFFAYDFLAPDIDHNHFAARNSLRWQQVSQPSDQDLYAIDVFSLAFTIAFSLRDPS